MVKTCSRFDRRRTLAHAGVRRDQAELPPQALGGGVPAHQRADAGAVDDRHGPQVDEETMHALLEAGLDQLLELLGGTAGHEVLLRRQHELARVGPRRKH